MLGNRRRRRRGHRRTNGRARGNAWLTWLYPRPATKIVARVTLEVMLNAVRSNRFVSPPVIQWATQSLVRKRPVSNDEDAQAVAPPSVHAITRHEYRVSLTSSGPPYCTVAGRGSVETFDESQTT